MSFESNIQKIKLKSEYNEADKIIRYLLHPDDESIDLSDKEKKRFDILKSVYALRMRYTRKFDIVKLIEHMHGLKERQAYKYITESEYVFGSIEGINKAFERNFLMECSRKNIEFAMTSKNSEAITKALLAHYKLCGLDEVIIDLPDFSALEPNTYVISLPKGQDELLTQLLMKGRVDLNELMPHQDVVFDIPHKDVTNGEE